MTNKPDVSVTLYEQNGQKFLSMVLPFEFVNRLSEVLIYGKSEYGYQREPVREHLLKIKKYLTDDSHKGILPTSIILGADENDMSKILFVSNDTLKLKIDQLQDSKMFRIVDGQHRLRGLEEAAKIDSRYKDFQLNVIVLVTPTLQRSRELNVFTDINSKSKRIRVDLAELAKHNYELLENRIDNLNRHIAIKVGYRLKEDSPNSVWHKGIKFDIHAEYILGIVGVTAFSESISPIIAVYLRGKKPANSDPSTIIHFTEDAAKEIADFIEQAWGIVSNKWQYCFKKGYEREYDGEVMEYFYDTNYYIQKTLGVKAINGILGDVVTEHGLTDKAITIFKEIISNSKLKTDDWLVGGLFSGLSSEAGVKKAKLIIRNENV